MSVRSRGGVALAELPGRSGALVEQSGVALELAFDLTFEDWQALGVEIARVANSSAWWIGDWVNFGERAYGEKYAEALALTGLAYKTLRNIASVCERIEVSRRRDTLSFGHHAEVAALTPREQETWLVRAEAEHLTREELRAQVTSAHRLPPSPALGVVRLVVSVPEEQATRWERQAEIAGLPFEEWAADVLDQACEAA